jgi:hypothetical protein
VKHIELIHRYPEQKVGKSGVGEEKRCRRKKKKKKRKEV